MSTTSSAFLPAVFGACIVIGLIGMVYALIPAPPKPPRPTRTVTPFGRLGSRFGRLDRRTRLLVIGGAVTGLLVALVTGWVIAIVLVPAAIIGIPLLLTPPPAAASIEKLEALEEWTRSLSGKLTAGQSLRSALIKSLQSTPEPIEREVGLMVSRLWNNTSSTEDVLRAFAEDLSDSTGDVVASQLILAASGRGQAGLSKALDALAETVAADVRARRQIAADQAKPRTTARTVTVITLGVLGILAFTGDYIEPYGTPLGQVVLAVLLAAYVATLLWMRRMAVAKPLPRFLDLDARNAHRAAQRTTSGAKEGAHA
jgi:Flp pilus assembly protein TadB